MGLFNQPKKKKFSPMMSRLLCDPDQASVSRYNDKHKITVEVGVCKQDDPFHCESASKALKGKEVRYE